jgi:hypothetical protein
LRLRFLAWLGGALLLGRSWLSTEPCPAVDARRAVAERAAERGLVVSPDQVQWIEAPPHNLGAWLRALWRAPLSAFGGSSRAAFASAEPGGLSDIFLAAVQTTPDGALLDVTFTNISRTPGATETDVTTRDGAAAWLVRTDAGVVGARLAQLAPTFAVGRAEAVALPSDWSWLERLQSRVQNIPNAGFFGSLRIDELALSPPAERAQLSFEAGTKGLRVTADGDVWRSHSDAPKVLDGAPRFTWTPDAPGRPGDLLPWAAEQLRETWLGEQGVAQLKAVGFAGIDYAERAVEAVLPSDGSTEVAEDLGAVLTRATHPAGSAKRDFPPAPLPPVLKTPLEGEGAWISLDGDPFIQRGPDGHVPFAFTFVRTDPSRPYAQVYVVLWDPRRVELHAVGGTEEPRSKAGERGRGRIPREPRVLGRLVAAFNGAFRPRHGDFGMAASGTVYLPPRPYAATVATEADGSTAFGTWPDSAVVPEGMAMFRQNMTALIQDGIVNPYRRHYWGGLPDGWTQESFTVRTALCLTRERFVAYIYGTSADPSSLMRAVETARCDYALHLDMNAGNTGFEFYRAAPKGHLIDLGRPLDEDWETRGTLDTPQQGDADFEFLARRLTRSMPLMNFPRYIQRETRDFFYLTLRPTLGERALPTSWKPSGKMNGWDVDQDGAGPPAIAHATASPFADRPQARVHILALDPQRLSAAPDEEPATPANDETVVQVLESAPSNTNGTLNPALWWSQGAFAIATEAPSAGAVRMGTLCAAPPNAPHAVGLVGIGEDGALLYAEYESNAGSAPTSAWMETSAVLGVTSPLMLAERLTIVIEGARRSDRARSVALRRIAGPGGRRLFPETPVVPPQVWALRQIAPVAAAPAR